MARALQEGGDALPRVELVPIETADGRGRDPSAPNDKSRFVKEIEEALLREEIDLAVHSAKDLPGELPDGLAIVGAPSAEDPRDALVGSAASLEELPHAARVGTSSLRRRSQLLAIRPDLEVTELRGNVDTRLRKLREGRCAAIVLALAGLRRLEREREAAYVFPAEEMVPASGQGILALEAREGDDAVSSAVANVSDPAAVRRLRAERAVVSALDTSCRTPVGSHASIEGEELRLQAYAGLPDGTEWIRDEVRGAGEPEALGRLLAERMVSAGVIELLRRAEATEATKAAKAAEGTEAA